MLWAAGEVQTPSGAGTSSPPPSHPSCKAPCVSDCRGDIALFQNGKKWQDSARECAKVAVGRCNTRYTLRPVALGAPGQQWACLGDIRYVDRIKTCLSPRKSAFKNPPPPPDFTPLRLLFGLAWETVER